jgi:hypothetical protein
MTSKQRLLRLWLNTLARHELGLRKRMATALNAYVKSAAKYYESTGSVPVNVDKKHQARVDALLVNHYGEVIKNFGAMTLKQITSRKMQAKQSQDLFASLVDEWIRREGLRKARLITDTSRAEVLKVIQRGMDDGEGNEQIGRNIRKVSSINVFRAATIARTETHQAATYGAQETALAAERDLGVQLVKEWLPTNDARTRDDHRAMAGVAVDLHEDFIVGGEAMDRPGDSSASPEQTLNCRCAILHREKR